MELPKSLINKWKKLYDKRDHSNLANVLGVSSYHIRKALKGNATPEIAEKITEYFNNKQKKVQELN